MRIQLALDDLQLSDAVKLCTEVAEFVDIIEIGTPMLLAEGMEAVRQVRAALPSHEVLADTKIMDAGEFEAVMAFEAGAAYCTVLGVTDDFTIKAAVDAANNHGAGTFVDLICVADVQARTRELEAFGVRHLAVHTGVDRQVQGVTPFEEFVAVKAASASSVISVAGGINLETIGDYRDAGADIVVVGSGITHADDPVATARALAEVARR